MPWTYQETYTPHVDDMIGGMTTTLSSLTKAQALTVKTAASDQQGGNARGLVVWHTDYIGDEPGLSQYDTGWMLYTWRTDHDYTFMYDGLIEALNGGGKLALSFEQAYHAKIAMTNVHDDDATLTLYWLQYQ